jgi:hypothetical protein
MKIAFSSLRLIVGLTATGVALIPAGARGQTPSAPVPRADLDKNAPLIISHGVAIDYTVDGQPVPATLPNLVQIVHQRYRKSNITLIGVDDVVIDSLILQWAPYFDPEFQPVPLEGLLNAFAAASGAKFSVRASERDNFLLVANSDLNPNPSPEADVVFIGRILHHRIDTAGVQSKIREYEVRKTLVADQDGDKNKDREIAELSNEEAFFQKQLTQANPSAADIDKVLAQISEVVTETLTKLQPNAKPPEFQFHPGSNLLVVIGSPRAVEITHKVIAALDQAP